MYEALQALSSFLVFCTVVIKTLTSSPNAREVSNGRLDFEGVHLWRHNPTMMKNFKENESFFSFKSFGVYLEVVDKRTISFFIALKLFFMQQLKDNKKITFIVKTLERLTKICFKNIIILFFTHCLTQSLLHF